jgi:hypothetical protein
LALLGCSIAGDADDESERALALALTVWGRPPKGVPAVAAAASAAASLNLNLLSFI